MTRILIRSPQCWLLKFKHKKFHVWEYHGQPGKGQGHFIVDYRKLTSYS